MKQFIKHFPGDNLFCLTTTKAFGCLSKTLVLEKLCNIFNIERNRLIFAGQIHSNKIALVKSLESSVIWGVDGLITGCLGIYLGIRTADCLPLFFYDPDNRLIGIAHAGWRGSLLGLSLAMVKNFIALGSKVSNLRVHIGPHIQRSCYEIGGDLADQFVKKFNDSSIIEKKLNKTFLDLKKVNIYQLLKVGLQPKNITFDDYCTFCNHDLFFSFRRDFKHDKHFSQMISLISLL